MDSADGINARHEATHAVVARKLGFPVVEVTIDTRKIAARDLPPGTAGVTDFPQYGGLDVPNASPESIDDWIVVRLVGDEFDQRRIAPIRLPTNDYRLACMDAMQLSGDSWDVCEQRVEGLRPEAQRLLDECWEAIDAVTAELLASRTLSGTDVDDLIGFAGRLHQDQS